jgi:hypothetical protein
MKSLLTTLLPSALLAPLSLASVALANPVLVGLEDDFAGDPEPLSPSPELAVSVAGFGGCQDLDLVAGVGFGSNDRQVAHTFTELPAGITRAWLETKVRAGDDPGVTSDGIFLSFVDASIYYYSDALVWRRSFGPASATPPYYPVDDPGLVGPWTPGAEATLVLPLHALPMPDGSTISITPLLDEYGFLDVNVSDETGADYFRLTWEVGAVDAPVVAAGGEGGAPGSIACHPNPCRGAAAISFVIEDADLGRGPARWSVYDVSGRRVRAADAPGSRIDWRTVDASGRALAPGTYFVRVETADHRLGRAKFVVVR